MKKTTIIVLAIIILIAIVIGIMYVIDTTRILKNKEAIFSTWGYTVNEPKEIKNGSKDIPKEDKIIFNYINRNLNRYEINYIILDNLDIIVKKEYENNNYLNYYFKINLINILERRLLNEK